MIRASDADTIVEEIHRTRRQLADRFDGDLTAILDDARRRQAASGRPEWQRKSPDGAQPSSDDDAPPAGG